MEQEHCADCGLIEYENRQYRQILEEIRAILEVDSYEVADFELPELIEKRLGSQADGTR